MESNRERTPIIIERYGYFERSAQHGDDITSITTVDTPSGKKDIVRFNRITGYLSDIYIYQKEIKSKQRWMVSMKISSGMEVRTLQLFLESNVAQDILTRIELLPAEPVEINLGLDQDKGRSFAWIETSIGKTPKKYTKATPHDLPPWEQIEVNGDLIWDKTKQIKWWCSKVHALNNYLQKHHLPQS